MSPLTQALLINAVVLLATLHADLGPDRKIGKSRILRPVLITAAIVPVFVKGFATEGAGLALEIAGAVAGLLIGALASSFMKVYPSPGTGRPVSRAGIAYAALWVVVVLARSAFCYGSQHWFGPQLGSWMIDNHISLNALTDCLILMAVAMMLSRTLLLAARASAVAKRTEKTPVLAR